jgi:hypothetical protein
MGCSGCVVCVGCAGCARCIGYVGCAGCAGLRKLCELCGLCRLCELCKMYRLYELCGLCGMQYTLYFLKARQQAENRSGWKQSARFPDFHFSRAGNRSAHHEFPTAACSFGSGTGYHPLGFPTFISSGRETGPFTSSSRPDKISWEIYCRIEKCNYPAYRINRCEKPEIVMSL